MDTNSKERGEKTGLPNGSYKVLHVAVVAVVVVVVVVAVVVVIFF